MKFFDKLERKYGKYAIRNLMKYIIVLYIIGWAIEIINQDFYNDILALNIGDVLHGEVWRLVTFIIMPPQDTSYLFMIFSLYLYIWIFFQLFLYLIPDLFIMFLVEICRNIVYNFSG